jgi:hypothetical protein
MAAITSRISTQLIHIGIDNQMDPCGRCGRSVSEICDFRLYIVEKDLNTNQLLNKFVSVPLHCHCINIDELNLIEPLDTAIMRYIIFFSGDLWDEIKIKEVLSRYILFMNNDIVNNYLEESIGKYLEETPISKNSVDKIKKVREIYEEFDIVNLKPAKQ